MVVIDVDLHGEKLYKFGEVFGSSPFSIKNSSEPGLNFVDYNAPHSEMQVEILSYANDRVVIYCGILRTLPNAVIDDVADRFRKLNLESLVSHLPKKDVI